MSIPAIMMITRANRPPTMPPASVAIHTEERTLQCCIRTVNIQIILPNPKRLVYNSKKCYKAASLNDYCSTNVQYCRDVC